MKKTIIILISFLLLLGGCSSNTNSDTLSSTDIKITNASVVKSTNTEFQFGSDNFENGDYYLQVNFDITNNSKEDITLNSLGASLCYSIGTTLDQCDYLPTLDKSEVPVQSNNLAPGETASIQFTPVVPEGANNFTINVIDHTKKTIYASSDILELV